MMITSPILYPQAIIFKCIKYAKCFYFSKTGSPVRTVKIENHIFFHFSLKIWTQKLSKRISFEIFLTSRQSVLLHTSSKSIFDLRMTSFLTIMTSLWRNNVTLTLRHLFGRSYNLNFWPICTSPTSAILNQSGSSSSLGIILRIILLRSCYFIVIGQL